MTDKNKSNVVDSRVNHRWYPSAMVGARFLSSLDIPAPWTVATSSLAPAGTSKTPTAQSLFYSRGRSIKNVVRKKRTGSDSSQGVETDGH
jgi:hypothetical protein